MRRFNGTWVGVYSIVVEAPGWKEACRQARRKFLSEDDLKEPKHGTIVLGMLTLIDEVWQ